MADDDRVVLSSLESGFAALNRVANESGAPPAPPSEPVVETPVASETPATAADDLEPGRDTFDRAYVEKVRAEAAEHRVKLREAESNLKAWMEATEGWSDDEAALARDLLVAVRTGDEATVAAILGLGEGSPPAPSTQPEDPGYLTKTDLQAALDERDRKAAEQQTIRRLEDEARGLGYKPDATRNTDEWLDWMDLLNRAQASDLSLAEAHAARQAAQQRIVERFLADKAGQNGSPAPPTHAGRDISTERPLSEDDPLGDSLRRMRERLGA